MGKAIGLSLHFESNTEFVGSDAVESTKEVGTCFEINIRHHQKKVIDSSIEEWSDEKSSLWDGSLGGRGVWSLTVSLLNYFPGIGSAFHNFIVVSAFCIMIFIA